MKLMTLIRGLDKHFEPVLIVTGVALITFSISLQIVLRYFDNPISWAEELARYLFVWVIYLSISYAIRDDRHIRITAVVKLLPLTGQLVCLIIADMIFLAYSCLVVYYGAHIIQRSLELGQISSGLEIPVAILYGSIVLGGALNVIRLIQRTIHRIQERHTVPVTEGVTP
ncbi:MAG: TRAP transporter small permease [Saccharospirillum sp.]|nr:TRAP transporter small permease [Saccharospirillum sp.]